MITFHQDLSTQKPLAYIGENDIILSAIVKQLQELNNDAVQVRYNVRVKGYKLPETAQTQNTDNQWAQVILDDGQVLQTKLLVRLLFWALIYVFVWCGFSV
jgi:hypothetical protein